MKLFSLQNLFAKSLIVLTGLAFANSSAKAATVSFNTGDLVLGFHTAGSGTGATSTYLVNLGSPATYRDAVADIPVTSIGSLGADLIANFGANWASRSDLFWSVAASWSNNPTVGGSLVLNGDPNTSYYLSKAQPTFGTQSSPPPAIGSLGGRQSVNGQIIETLNLFDTFDGTTLNNGFGIVIPTGAVDDGTWDEKQTPNSFQTGYDAQGNFGTGVTGTALDLYRVVSNRTATGVVEPGASNSAYNYQGTFVIDALGNLTFNLTPGAVPEPSRFVLLGLGLAGLVLRRRRNAAL
jgi:hypothetical protein